MRQLTVVEQARSHNSKESQRQAYDDLVNNACERIEAEGGTIISIIPNPTLVSPKESVIIYKPAKPQGVKRRQIKGDAHEL